MIMKQHFKIDDTVRPKYCKARPVPYAMKLLVEEELERLCKEESLNQCHSLTGQLQLCLY